MQWEGRRESENVEDRRAIGPKTGVALGGGSLLVLLLVWLLGGDPKEVLRHQQEVQQRPGGQAELRQTQEEQRLVKFVKVILADTEDVWEAQFRNIGKAYRKPKLVLFSGQVESACGFASAAMGPFYCPADETVYIDLAFYDELRTRFKAPGDFAQAYVIAHEVGHHVQKLLGISDKVHEQRRRLSEVEYNHLSVRLELQADYLAGVWGYHIQKAKKVLDPGDLDEALRAAHAIGDDLLQKKARGRVVPDSFTHGTSDQRIRWFRRGFETGNMQGMHELFKLRYEEL
jgi:hypothetical protein